MAQIRLNLNFFTILKPFFLDFPKRLKHSSFGLEKRFYLGLSLIVRIFLEKIHGVYSPGQMTRFQ